MLAPSPVGRVGGLLLHLSPSGLRHDEPGRCRGGGLSHRYSRLPLVLVDRSRWDQVRAFFLLGGLNSEGLPLAGFQVGPLPPTRATDRGVGARPRPEGRRPPELMAGGALPAVGAGVHEAFASGVPVPGVRDIVGAFRFPPAPGLGKRGRRMATSLATTTGSVICTGSPCSRHDRATRRRAAASICSVVHVAPTPRVYRTG